MNSVTVQQCIQAKIKTMFPPESSPQANGYFLDRYQWRTEVSASMREETLRAFSLAEAYKRDNPLTPEPEAELEAMEAYLQEFEERLREQAALLPRAA